jgi:hypothetical protein
MGLPAVESNRGSAPREPLAWLLAVARHECYARFRQRTVAPVPTGDLPDGQARTPPRSSCAPASSRPCGTRSSGCRPPSARPSSCARSAGSPTASSRTSSRSARRPFARFCCGRAGVSGIGCAARLPASLRGSRLWFASSAATVHLPCPGRRRPPPSASVRSRSWAAEQTWPKPDTTSRRGPSTQPRATRLMLACAVPRRPPTRS